MQHIKNIAFSIVYLDI